MNPALIIFAIQSVIRLGKIGRDASEQYARDAGAIFPKVDTPEFDRKAYVNGFFGSANYRHYVQGDDAPYRPYWGSHGVKNDINSLDTLFAAAVQIKSQEGIDLNQWLSNAQTIAGATLIEQWNPEKAPLSPFARVILAAGDIALEYASAAILDQPEMNGQTVLFGKTLREAIIIVLRATSGNLKAAMENLNSISNLVTSLNMLIIKNADQFGSKEWLYLFRVLLASVLEGQELEVLTVRSANNLLMGRM